MLDLFVRDREIVCSNFRVRALNWIKLYKRIQTVQLC